MYQPEPFSEWEGYRPVPHGYEQSYHVKQHPRTKKWTISMRLNGDTYFAIPEESKGIEEVTTCVRYLANEFDQPPGGVITVNEFKQIIKPFYRGRDYGVVNVYLGRSPNLHLVFEDGQNRIDNSIDTGLTAGTAWPYQKIGIRYLYRAHQDDVYMIYGDFFNQIEISFNHELGIDCKYLISLVRVAKKGSGGVFYVNEHGLVFAPCYDPPEDTEKDAWTAVYVGRIDYNRWLTSDLVSKPLLRGRWA